MRPSELIEKRQRHSNKTVVQLYKKGKQDRGQTSVANGSLSVGRPVGLLPLRFSLNDNKLDDDVVAGPKESLCGSDRHKAASSCLVSEWSSLR